MGYPFFYWDNWDWDGIPYKALTLNPLGGIGGCLRVSVVSLEVPNSSVTALQRYSSKKGYPQIAKLEYSLCN